MSKINNQPTPDRSPHLLSTILFPIEEPPQHSTDQQATTASESEPVRL
jgi:hypothetical protein